MGHHQVIVNTVPHIIETEKMADILDRNKTNMEELILEFLIKQLFYSGLLDNKVILTNEIPCLSATWYRSAPA